MAQNRLGWSPVMYASAAGHREALLVLLTAAGDEGEGCEARVQAVTTAVHYNSPDMLAFFTEVCVTWKTIMTFEIISNIHYQLVCVD